MTPPDGVLLAERTEGIASVAHALAFCHAVERIAGCEVPRAAAALIRVLHAELERIANHLDVAVRLADAAGLAVATARFGAAQGTGHAAGQPDVRAAGSAAAWWSRAGSARCRGWPAPSCCAEVDGLDQAVTADARRADGHRLVPGPAARHRPADPGAGPRARRARPDRQGVRVRRRRPAGPAVRRLPGAGRCRARRRTTAATPWPGCGCGGRRSDQSFGLLRQAAEELRRTTGDQLRRPLRARRGGGRSAGPRRRRARCSTTSPWPTGRIARCQPRSASFHNLVLMHEVFAGDILTDFPFIEASFGLSVAGVAL